MDPEKLKEQQYPAIGRPKLGKNIQGRREKETRRIDRTSGDNPEAGRYP
ncbi:MAG: hypothetical protein LBK83_07925 [Treponema sp.]|nr:hypothetical protein [Treponema sp.]